MGQKGALSQAVDTPVLATMKHQGCRIIARKLYHFANNNNVITALIMMGGFTFK